MKDLKQPKEPKYIENYCLDCGKLLNIELDKNYPFTCSVCDDNLYSFKTIKE